MTEDRQTNLRKFAHASTIAAVQDPVPLRFAKLANKLAQVADHEIETLQSAASERGIVPACAAGCDACCHRICGATLPELFSAAEFVRSTFSDGQMAALRLRNESTQRENADYWHCRSSRANAPCPFLENHICTVYEVRPSGCRTRNSVDANACQRLYIDGISVDLVSVPGQRELLSLNGQVNDVLFKSGIASGTYEFAPAVIALMDHPEIGGNLRRVHPVLERTKIAGQMIRDKPAISPPTLEIKRDPVKSKALEKVASGSIEEARSILGRLPLSPFSALFGMALPYHYSTMAHLEESWRIYEDALDRFESADLPSKETFNIIEEFNTYPLAYTGRDVKPLLSRLMASFHRHAKRAYPQFVAPIEYARRPGPFRLGIMSPRIATSTALGGPSVG